MTSWGAGLDMYYDKQGNVISEGEYRVLKYKTPGYKRVAATTLPDGTWISTVWLGMNHAYTASQSPIIFETMVFSSGMSDGYMMRYSTLEDALNGHARMVQKFS